MPWGLKSKSLTPGSLKGLTDNKLKAFNIGSMNVAKVLTRKEMDEMRRRRNEQETAEVYKEFVETFENSNKGLSTAWVKGEVVTDKEHCREKTTERIEKLYKPGSKYQVATEIPCIKAAMETLPSLRKDDKMVKPASLKKKGLLSAERKKTNLELFKEELKVIQEERSERRKVRMDLGLPAMDTSNTAHPLDNEDIASGFSIGILPTAEEIGSGFLNYENDTQTTNIYLGNLCPKMTEIQICEIFGHFGPLASVKVMWPRTDEEKSRGRNCGFVAFMNRKDGERALNNLQGKEIMTFEMKLGWGKCVVIPPHPIYIPPALSQLTLPPPPSGLPFNAQPINQSKELDRCVVKVVIPTEKTLMCVIHRTIEFVVREGPMFEAMIMNRELHNPLFRFLFENKMPAHIYYRWKLYSILQGDSPCSWKGDEFVMFEGGSIWKPPPKNPFSQGMPDELISGNTLTNNSTNNTTNNKRMMLSERHRDRLEDMLRSLTVERVSVGDCMLWCLKHADFAEEIVDCISQAVSQPDIPPHTSIARLFLISDLLHNSSARLPNASYYRRFFELKLVEIFKSLRTAHASINARLKAEQFKQKVMCCFRAWEDWTIYNNDFLINLQNIFLGLVLPKQLQDSDEEADDDDNEDVDGIPLEELDGLPMVLASDQADQQTTTATTTNPIIPYANDSDSEPALESSASLKPSFVPSKWEQVDENELESQAMTVSKWDSLNQSKGIVDYDEDEEDIDGVPVDELQNNNIKEYRSSADQSMLNKDETKRTKLKEIEMKVLRYQDELEGVKGGHDKKAVTEKVNEYRQKLLKKELKSDSREKSSKKSEKKKKESRKRRREDDDEDDRESSRTKDSSLVAYNSSNEDSSNSSSQNDRHRKSPRKRKSPKRKSSKKNRR